MAFRALVVPALLAAALYGCAGRSATDEPVVQVVGSPSLVAAFPVITGAVWGAPDTEPLVFAPAPFGGTMTVPLKELEQKIQPMASPATPESLKAGLLVQPEDTRLARVGTFFADKEQERYVFGAGFIDQASGDFLVLVYVDRPCTLSGTVSVQELPTQYHVQIPTPGMHWLRHRKVDNSHYEVEYESGGGPILFRAN